MNKYSLKLDINGNQVCKVTPPTGRGFLIQTLDSMPVTHRNGICDQTENEVKQYVAKFGTRHQKDIMGI